MRVLGISGWSGSGKTTLITRLLPVLVARGLTVSTIKHAHHGFDIDQPGKDSFHHRNAGANEVLISSATRWAHMGELRGACEPDLDQLIARLSPVDLVLVEGYRSEAHEKIEVCRTGSDNPLLYPDNDSVIAVATDAPLPKDPGARTVLNLDDIDAIADFVVGLCTPPAGNP